MRKTPSYTVGLPVPDNVSLGPSYGSLRDLTVSSFNPKAAALERMILSIKLSMYVMKSRGINLLSIFRNTRFATAFSIPCSVAEFVLDSAILSVDMQGNDRTSNIRRLS